MIEESLRIKVTKILTLTTSDNDGEALSAIRMANKILKDNNISWEKVFDQVPSNQSNQSNNTNQAEDIRDFYRRNMGNAYADFRRQAAAQAQSASSRFSHSMPLSDFTDEQLASALRRRMAHQNCPVDSDEWKMAVSILNAYNKRGSFSYVERSLIGERWNFKKRNNQG